MSGMTMEPSGLTTAPPKPVCAPPLADPVSLPPLLLLLVEHESSSHPSSPPAKLNGANASTSTTTLANMTMRRRRLMVTGRTPFNWWTFACAPKIGSHALRARRKRRSPEIKPQSNCWCGQDRGLCDGLPGGCLVVSVFAPCFRLDLRGDGAHRRQGRTIDC